MDSYFCDALPDDGGAGGSDNAYLELPGMAPILVTRDPRVIRAISAETGDKPGQFDRDTLPSAGIARATGADTLLYANGASWRAQKKLATPPFARTNLFQPERFEEFAATFRHTVYQRIELVRQRAGSGTVRVALEEEVKAIMLEMLVVNFFGAPVDYDTLRHRYVPALECVIQHIVRDTVLSRFGLPLHRVPAITASIRRARESQAIFEELTTLVLMQRKERRGLWSQFESEAPDDALRGNIRVFLAGALEATTSYACWALDHLARHPELQNEVFEEVRSVVDYSPQNLERAKHLNRVLNETLRLTPSLYFHPRRATADTWITTNDGATLMIPDGTHILLDVWHANRNERYWGIESTGFPAGEFAPERWKKFEAEGVGQNERLHFGFGHGPRFCPGKSLGQLEVALLVGGCIKAFQLRAVNPHPDARAGVSTKPLDGVLVDIRLQDHSTSAAKAAPAPVPPSSSGAKCPFGFRA